MKKLSEERLEELALWGIQAEFNSFFSNDDYVEEDVKQAFRKMYSIEIVIEGNEVVEIYQAELTF